jgi:hypothetical protein
VLSGGVSGRTAVPIGDQSVPSLEFGFTPLAQAPGSAQRNYRRSAGCDAGQEFAPPDQGDARPLLDSEAVLQLLDQLRILCKNPLEFGPRFR